jgi:formate hydrogenlyase transcriptional activator
VTTSKISSAGIVETPDLQLLVDSTPGLVHTGLPDGYLDFFNQTWVKFVGRSLEELQGWKWTECIHPDDVDGIVQKWRASLASGEPFLHEARVRRADGEYRWMLHHKLAMRDEHGKIFKWYGSSIDIEDRKQAEAWISAEKRLLEMTATGVTLEKILNALCLFIEEQRSGTLASVLLLDPDGVHLRLAAGPSLANEWNEQMEKLPIGPCAGSCGTAAYTGSPVIVSDIATDPLWELPEHRASALKHGLRASWSSPVLSSRGKVLGTFCMYYREPRSPEARDLELLGSATHLVGVAIGRDRAEQDLRRSEAYLAEAQGLSHTGSFGWKPDSGEIVWSDETYNIFEFDRATKPTIDLIVQRVHPEDRADFQKVIDGAFGGATHFEHTYRLLLPDERVKHVQALAHEVQNASGNREFVGAGIDVTQRKRAEQNLLQSEAYLAEAQRLSQTGSWAWNPATGEIRYWSEECYRVLGFDPHGPLPRFETFFQRLHRDDQAYTREQFDNAIRDKADFEMEYRIVHPDKGIRNIQVVGHAVLDQCGDLREMVGTVIDITERKAAEKEIREQEMELRQILDFAAWHVAVLGADGKAIYLNKAGLDYHGLTCEEWQDYDPHRLIHPDDHDRILTGAGGAKLLSGEPFENEARLLRKDGKYRWFLFRFNPLKDGEGRITRWYVTNADIEDRKQTEEKLRDENIALREEISKASMFEEIVGASPALQTVLSRISKVAPVVSTVLITGETGTGKELIARAIHRRSQRCSRPFVSVNCAAIPRDLIASELFGHEKGAFTGALQRRLGKFELAEGGTLFLDEIGELPAETQIALLRVLQEHEFERVGGNQLIRIDVRVIAATNRDLQAAISAGTFRSDLFYRLNVFPIEVPPLRERKEDTAMLVEYFIDRFARQVGKKIKSIDKKTLELVQAYPWPGNIRELQNVIERSVVLCETEIFSVDESWLSRASSSSRADSHTSLKEPVLQEREIIEAALAESKGRVSGPAGAAAKLGIPSTTLESKIKSLKINKHQFKAS